jgi:predicted metal-dependent enzyme (double-stranded beta helix superfamily)
MSAAIGSVIEAPRLERLRDFVVAFSAIVGASRDEQRIRIEGGELLRKLVSVDDWLPQRYAEPDPVFYRQFLLHSDSEERFSVVSFVWGPGQATPIHDHTVWGLIGVLRGSEREQHYERAPDGSLAESGPVRELHPGDVGFVSPATVDLHKVSNAFDDRVSISIHVYGANIGRVRRSVYEPSGLQKSFVSGYSNQELPNIWSDSK